MADPMSDEPLRDRIARKLAEWAFQAAETKGVKLTSFHRHIIEQEAPERADMVMEVVRPELERLRAELAADQAVGYGAKYWHDAYQEHAGAVDEFFGELLDLMPGAADVGADAHDQIPRGIEKLTAERDRLRTAWDSARRGRRSARLLNRELIASMDVLHGRLQKYMDDKNTAAAHFTNQYSRMHLERDQMRTERDEAREQVKRARGLADRIRTDPAPMSAAYADLIDRALDGDEPARPDPRLEALEGLAVRYPDAFEWLLADAKARATRKENGQ